MQRQFRSDDTSPWSPKFGNGADGAYAPSTGTDAPIDSACTGTSGATSLTATNVSFASGQLILIHQTQGTGAGNWELNKIATYSTGTITTSYALINTYGTGAQVLVMPQYLSGSIAGGVTITGKAWNGTVGGIYAKFCTQTFTIAGTLALSAGGFRDGSGHASSGSQGKQGEGTVGAPGYTTATNGNGAGGGSSNTHGGGVGCGGSGGGGGNANAGSNGVGDSVVGGSSGGTGGSATGLASLTTMTFGGVGGTGGNYTGDNSRGGDGGAGGAIALIIAKTIIISGGIANNAGNGGDAIDNNGGGGGGGAGGSILFKGQNISLGTNLLTVAVGGGGQGNDGAGKTTGASGSVGRIHADYSISISGTTTPTIDTTLDTTIVAGGGSASFLLNFL